MLPERKTAPPFNGREQTQEMGLAGSPSSPRPCHRLVQGPPRIAGWRLLSSTCPSSPLILSSSSYFSLLSSLLLSLLAFCFPATSWASLNPLLLSLLHCPLFDPSLFSDFYLFTWPRCSACLRDLSSMTSDGTRAQGSESAESQTRAPGNFRLLLIFLLFSCFLFSSLSSSLILISLFFLSVLSAILHPEVANW